ncbi:MAG: hypothetical protein HQL07_06480 [Nitrospirae bacterium]|nr:hypothetical protein [Magnetococcales bacterium]HAT51367.1 hypothetical protein [Alphaproteobacteria bacterium]
MIANLGAVYGVNLPPAQPEQLGSWVYQELSRIANATREAKEIVTLVVLHTAPTKSEDGNLVYADGTHWNPGSGGGFYGRENGQWIKL